MEKDLQRLTVLITGTSSGIGKATAEKFLDEGYFVFGFDILPSSIMDKNYEHFVIDVRKKETFPDIQHIDYLINNAGTIREDESVETNLIGYINIAEKYAFQTGIKSVVNVGSISGHVGLDTPMYSASQGGRLAYTKNLAIRLSKVNKCPVNSVSFGAVMTDLEPQLYAQPDLVKAVANESLLKKWITVTEAAEWIFFVAVKNKSMMGQDILIDNGEVANYNFIESNR